MDLVAPDIPERVEGVRRNYSEAFEPEIESGANIQMEAAQAYAEDHDLDDILLDQYLEARRKLRKLRGGERGTNYAAGEIDAIQEFLQISKEKKQATLSYMDFEVKNAQGSHICESALDSMGGIGILPSEFTDDGVVRDEVSEFLNPLTRFVPGPIKSVIILSAKFIKAYLTNAARRAEEEAARIRADRGEPPRGPPPAPMPMEVPPGAIQNFSSDPVPLEIEGSDQSLL